MIAFLRKIILVMVTIVCPLVAFSQAAQICDDLNDQANQRCAADMCEQFLIEQGLVATPKDVQDCIENSDGDLWEGAQICAIDGGVFDALLENYNKENPNTPLSCEDF